MKLHRPDLKSTERVALNHLLQILPAAQNQTLRLLDDGSLYTEFIIPAAAKTRLSPQIAFANSLLGPSFNYESPRIVLDDYTEVPEEVLQDIRHATEKWTENIDWMDGDIAIIDNTRTMHGRRKIVDANRSLFNTLSFHKTNV